MKQDKYALIEGDIHKLIKIKDDECWSQYAWRIPYQNDYYFVPVKDEVKANFIAPTWGYKRKRIFNNYDTMRL